MWIIMPLADTMNQPNAEIIQKNITEMGEKVTSGVSGISSPTTVGIILIILGGYFLFSTFGWLDWVRGGVFWPLLIIALGGYLLVRRN
jgi:hypothetical protein